MCPPPRGSVVISITVRHVNGFMLQLHNQAYVNSFQSDDPARGKRHQAGQGRFAARAQIVVNRFGEAAIFTMSVEKFVAGCADYAQVAGLGCQDMPSLGAGHAGTQDRCGPPPNDAANGVMSDRNGSRLSCNSEKDAAVVSGKAPAAPGISLGTMRVRRWPGLAAAVSACVAANICPTAAGTRPSHCRAARA